MDWKTGLTAAAIVAVAMGQSSQPAWSASGGVKAGVLTCDVASGWGLVFGSTRDLKCTYAADNGHVEHYSGHINKYGVDVGYKAAGVIAWAVLAPTTDVAKGALRRDLWRPDGRCGVRRWRQCKSAGWWFRPDDLAAAAQRGRDDLSSTRRGGASPESCCTRAG